MSLSEKHDLPASSSSIPTASIAGGATDSLVATFADGPIASLVDNSTDTSGYDGSSGDESAVDNAGSESAARCCVWQHPYQDAGHRFVDAR